jgi:hypothetical protein
VRRSAAGTGPWLMGAGGRCNAEQGRRVADPWAQGHNIGRRSLNHLKIFKRFENVQISPNFDRSNFDIPEVNKFVIKYEFEYLKKMNNFVHRNFFRFRMDFKLKI